MASVFSEVGGVYLSIGDLDKALEKVELGFKFTKNSNNQTQIGISYQGLAAIYSFKGEIEEGIRFSEKSLEAYKKVDNKIFMSIAFNNMSWSYRIIGELDRALECIESAIKIGNELGNLRTVAGYHDYLIRILIDKGDIERARDALERLEHLTNQLKDEHLNLIYKFNKALLLKTSTRSRDRGRAEETLKQIIEDETISSELTIDSLLNLCELLLTELGMTNDLEILEEINTFTAQLLEIAETSHSFSLFAEIYFLKAKLALLTLDVKTARRFLTQAQKVAERFGLSRLADKISLEHENLIEQLNMWENLKNTEISLTERIKLAGLDKHMKETLKNSALITSQISEQKVTVHKEQKICLVCKGKIRGYIFVCDCDAIYCETCARALADLENVCWVCNTPIDISKPTKPFKKEKLKEKDIIKKTPKK
jgi:tetratricopeptide (TPR) repeat protein